MPTIDLTEFVTMEGVPVLETGIEYPASTGPFSVTSAMIREAVRFTQDPHGMNPRIKIAHADNPINADLQDLYNELNQGRDASLPSLGTIINLRAENADQTLVGDWYGLPAWLAAILETAYPARSIEGGAWHNDANGKSYEFMVEAVSLLGVVGPGCTSLADLQELFSSEGPKVSVIEMARPKTSIQMGGTRSMPVVAQVNVEDIRRSFYDDFAQGDRYWWWDRELLADPWAMIVEDWDTGQLYSVPFTVNEDEHGDAAVEWGNPEPIKINYVPDTGAIEKAKASEEGVAAAAKLVGPQLENAGKVLAVNTRSPRHAERKHYHKEAKAAMAVDIPALRNTLNVGTDVLPDDATEEQINAAITAGVQPDTEAEGGEQENEETTEAEAEAGATEVTINAGGRTVTIDRDVWEQTRSGAELAHQMARDQREAADKAFLAGAVKAGKISPASRDAYMARLAGPSGNHDAPDRDSIRSFIDGLEAGVVVPTTELGSAESGDRPRNRGTGLLPELQRQEA